MGSITSETDWKLLVSAKNKSREKTIPPKWLVDQEILHELKSCPRGRLLEVNPIRRSNILTEAELEITEQYSAAELLRKLNSAELSSVAVTTAFCKRSAVAQQLTSCLTEIFFKEAINRAEELDRHLQKHGKPVGPLHGLPISCKDTFNVKGHHATAGYVMRLKEPVADTNSTLVDLLLDAGAVLYTKTNIPQTLMTADSENNIFGRTLNPHNLFLTAGGSTGGEGSLIAFRGSPLGIGTDIAGSIRIPAMCCGIYGFKPTSDRVPWGGQSGPPGLLRLSGGIIPSAGPMGHSVQDLKLAMSAIINARPWLYDATAHDIAWRELGSLETPFKTSVPQGKLTIGILPEDPAYALHPPVRRSVDTAATNLEKAGHHIVWLPRDSDREVGLGMRLAFQFFGAGFEGGLPDLGEPPVASVAQGAHPFTIEIPPVSKDSSFAKFFSNLEQARTAYSDAWRRTWKDYGLDVVLAPGAMNSAVPFDTYGLPPYTVMWNLVDFPVCQIPFGNVSKVLDPTAVEAPSPFVPRYEPDALDGAPLGLQIIAPRFRDEECLMAAEVIDRDMRA